MSVLVIVIPDQLDYQFKACWGNSMGQPAGSRSQAPNSWLKKTRNYRVAVWLYAVGPAFNRPRIKLLTIDRVAEPLPGRCVPRGCSSVGRAPDLHSGGRRFDPDQLHQLSAVTWCAVDDNGMLVPTKLQGRSGASGRACSSVG